MDATTNKPGKRFRCGPISASIWAQTKTVNGELVKFYSINIDKAYKDGDAWKWPAPQKLCQFELEGIR